MKLPACRHRGDEVFLAAECVLWYNRDMSALTPQEEREYKGYVDAADIIGIIQAKARRFLAKYVT